MNREQMLKALTALINRMFPELGQKTHLSMKARVVAANSSAGAVSTTGSQHYSVDVQPLHPDGTPDGTRPMLRDVPLEMAWPGPSGRGVYALPAVGSIVRVAFYGGSAAHPYIEGIVPIGFDVPPVVQGEYLVQHSDGVKIRISADGEMFLETTQPLHVKSSALVTVDAPVIELAGGGPAVARVGDQITGTCPHGPVTGQIASGSPVVNSG